MTKIYLVTNCYGDPNKVYIGKTKNSRELSHKRTYGNTIKYSYIDEVYSLNRSDWGPIESYWIEQFRQWGFEIVNKNKKGGGGPEFQTEEAKKKISSNIDRRKKISTSMVGKKKSPESVEKSRQSNIGRKDSYESRKKKSISALGIPKPKPSDFGEKIRKSKTGHTCFKNPTRNKKIKEKLSKPVGQYDRKGNLIYKWKSQTQAATSFGKYSSMISECCKGKRKSAYGFIWKYIN